VSETSTAQRRRRLGLLLLLVGLALVAGGLFLPWLRIDCLANCGYGYGTASWPLVRGPVATDGLFLFVCWPVWLLVLVCGVLTAVEEFRPTERHTAVPALLLAAMLLVMLALVFLLIGFTGFSPAPRPVVTYTLLPGCPVSLLGVPLVAVGGWLRYHSRRRETARMRA
jgi:hypothetical protein